METNTKSKKMHGTIVDVRTPEEFNSDRFEGSVNIPLIEIMQRVDELKSMEQPLVLCCASGARSAVATRMLAQHRIECINAGSWINVLYQFKNN
jgi:phage shock protein E